MYVAAPFVASLSRSLFLRPVTASFPPPPMSQVAKMNDVIHAHILQGSEAQNANAAADEEHVPEPAHDEKPAALVNPDAADADANAVNHPNGKWQPFARSSDAHAEPYAASLSTPPCPNRCE